MADNDKDFPDLEVASIRTTHQKTMDAAELDAEAARLLESEQASIPPPPAMPDPYLGVTIDGRYRVEEILGEGGMGVVYRGRHKIIDKPVAIKILRADLARDAEILERFMREARAASSVGNPHIIDISDFGMLPNGSTYFVMEYLDGIPLSYLMEGNQPVPVDRLLAIARQMALGLAAAHECQIVHRDIKPDNFFLVERGNQKDFVKILDFGIAKVATGTTKLTRHGSVFGTPHYMSPEQAAGAPLDHRTDIYSLGVIMYEMATGNLPFDADSFMGILTQHMYQAPVPIRSLLPPRNLPAGLEAIVLKCLSKKPDQRYRDMGELIEDIDRLLEGEQPEAVADMMSRSGSFNIPADQLKPAMPAPLPATPAGINIRARWPRFLVSLLALLGIGVGVFVYQSNVTLTKELAAVASVPSAPSAASSTAFTAPSVESIAQVPPPIVVELEPKQVMIVTDPPNADVFVQGERVGNAPVLVPVPQGKSLSVKVASIGHQEETFELNGSEPRKDITLQRIDSRSKKQAQGPMPTSSPTPAQSSPTPPKPSVESPPTMGYSEIVHPWKR